VPNESISRFSEVLIFYPKMEELVYEQIFRSTNRGSKPRHLKVGIRKEREVGKVSFGETN
jgi:hypothetical protein